MAEDDDYFEITVTAPPDEEGLWAGASGMPVFVDGDILGVVRSVPPNFRSKKLYAIPTWKMFQDDEFCKLLGLADERKKYLEEAKESIKQILEPSEARSVAQNLADRLGVAWIGGKTSSDKIAEALLKITIENLFEIAEDIQASLGQGDSEGMSIIADVVQLILPVLIHPVLVEELHSCKADVEFSLMPIPFYFDTVAEVVMAGVDRRATRYRIPAVDDPWPEGEANLSQSPDPGRDEKGQQTVKDLREHLSKALEPGASDQFALAFC